MPRSKHRRKPGKKAVAHPGSGKPGKPLRAWLDELNAEPEEPDTAGLPLFDWAEKKEDRRRASCHRAQRANTGSAGLTNRW
jgi:hypothetical protein